MKTKINFYGGLIVVPVILNGDNNFRFIFAIDTGANRTIVLPSVINLLGNQSMPSKTRLTSGSKSNEKVGETVLRSCNVYDFNLLEYRVYVKTLPKTIDYIDGLLGYDFFQELNLKLLLDFENNILSIT